ncbi:hypothetical protein HY224_03220, partial [Candidatus Uhrbacteria bacterium]|nr:hypothetical protein [Candidatus Uhrbacteria bacterium]
FGTKENPSDPDEPLVLDENEPVYVWDEYNGADENGSLVYQPNELTENHGGKTKAEVLGSGKHAWKVLFIEDMPNIPREGKGVTKGGRKQIDTKGGGLNVAIETGKTIPSPAEYLKSVLAETKKQNGKYEHEEGMTPEEQLIYAITHLEETNQVIDDYQGKGSVSYNLGAYFPASSAVPGSCWGRGGRQARLGGRDRDIRYSFCGIRPAVRV